MPGPTTATWKTGAAFAAFVSIIVVGMATFAVVGFWANRWIAARYQEKRLSDQSIPGM